MTIYNQVISVQGDWVKAANLTNGGRAKIVTETRPIPSQFKEKDGVTPKVQDVAKVRFEGHGEFNVAFNRATLNALVAAFGQDSTDWVDKILTVRTEKMIVGGRRVTALFLVPEGFELKEDSEGYLAIVSEGMPVPSAPEDLEDTRKPVRDEDLPF